MSQTDETSPASGQTTPGQGSLARQIAALAVPAFATLVSEPLLLMADSALVGHLGTPELGALGLAGSVLTVLVGLSIFLAYGTTSVVSRLLGAGRRPEALAAGIDGMVLGLGLGVVLALVLQVLAPTVIGWYGASDAVAAMGASYLRISSWGLPFLLLSLASTGVLRGLQDTRTPLVVAISMNLANIGLNWLLIYPAGLGLRGSAFGTLIAQAGGATALAFVVLSGARREGARLRPNPAGVLAAAASGVWLVLRSLWLQVCSAVTVAVAARTGAVGLAAHQVTNSVWAFLCLALDSLAIAAQALVGHELGAGRAPRARSIMSTLCWWGAGGGLVFGAALALAHGLVAPIFTPDAEVQATVGRLFVVLAVATVVGGVVFVLDGVLIGAGDAKYLAAAGFLAMACFLPLALVVGSRGLGVTWLWSVYCVYLLARLATLAWRSRGDAWIRLGV